MERRGRSFSDDSALTKSAAWAWLERRSGTESRSKPEFDFSRKKSDGAPSRYKAEAMKKKVEESSNSNLSLLDRYDIERISRQLDFYIESSRSSRRGSGGDGGRRAETKSKNGGKEAGKGLWLGSHAPIACGSSRGEVVEIKSIEPMRRRRSSSENGRAAAAMEVVGCRPRQGIRA